jgi:hypothetical protein
MCPGEQKYIEVKGKYGLIYEITTVNHEMQKKTQYSLLITSF